MLKDLGFRQSLIDPCLYILKKPDGKILIFVVYVDDIISATNCQELRKEIIGEMQKILKITDMDKAKWLLGTRITSDGNYTRLDQLKYTNDILSRYQMQDCALIGTPAEPKENHKPWKSWKKHVSPNHWKSTDAKRILCYLKGTSQLGLEYSKDGNRNLIGFSDSDWAGNKDGRKSTGAYIFMLAGAPVSWRSKRQSVVALSSTEAEYIAAANAAREAIYLRKLLADMEFPQEETTVVYEDNQGAIKLANSNGVNQRTKHIDEKYHYVKDMVEKKEIKLEYLSTSEMLADCLTKAIGKSTC